MLGGFAVLDGLPSIFEASIQKQTISDLQRTKFPVGTPVEFSL
jgi:hypothetical protein